MNHLENEVTFAHFDAEGVDVQVLEGNADVIGYVSDNGLISFDRFGNITYVERGDKECLATPGRSSGVCWGSFGIPGRTSW